MNERGDEGPGPPASPALFAFFERLPRQGPGSASVTRALYGRLRSQLPATPHAADMGCGSGAAGLVLAEAGARVVGVDVHQPYLDAFAAAAQARGMADRVTTRRASMTESGLAPGSLDLIWSEGAVFTVGYDDALVAFRALLRSGGLVVVSELAWLERPVAGPAFDFWHAAYPPMRTVGGNLAAAEAAGWRFLHAEVLPATAWEHGFYRPMEALIAEIEATGTSEQRTVAAEQRREIEVFRAQGNEYGYVFFVLQSPPRAQR